MECLYGIIHLTVPEVMESSSQDKMAFNQNNNDLIDPNSKPSDDDNAKHHLVLASLYMWNVPGIKKEEVKVEVEEGRILQISGERNREQEEKNDQWHRMKRSNDKFLRRSRLPENTKIGEIKAAMEDGVLIMTVPKEEEKKPEVMAIDISG
ncbi:hypothetical protein CQW23_31621 [Capsicum baccatum]|uniref:SHSP domain-containing protein n=1 Tax=Capsicum baccatum TaxID=33114 RepID=A0A2G2V739_CAPBA|nr:hypothetical protein CQW23_31621 [Capsicum baccatum]